MNNTSIKSYSLAGILIRVAIVGGVILIVQYATSEDRVVRVAPAPAQVVREPEPIPEPPPPPPEAPAPPLDRKSVLLAALAQARPSSRLPSKGKCSIRIWPGVSAGPVRLGMKRKELDALKLSFKENPLAPGWLKGGAFRVRLDAKTRAVAFIEVDPGAAKGICDGSPPMKCNSDVFNIGATVVDCSPSGARYISAGPYNSLARVEVFPPVVPDTTPRPECAIMIVPGVSAGPVRLGMTRKEVAETGPAFDSFPDSRTLIGGAYAVDFSYPEDRATSISVGLAEGGCLADQRVESSWKPTELCAHGFCNCTLNGNCPEGVSFMFSRGGPHPLTMLKIIPKQ